MDNFENFKLNQILDILSNSGIESLTKYEKDYLESVSNKNEW